MNHEKNIFYQASTVSRSERSNVSGKKFQGCTLWFTGLSGSGKSTIAFGVEQYLVKRNINAYTLDGDNIRHGLNSDLGFSEKDREENIRRVAEVSKLFSDSGMITISSFISPFKKDRQNARDLHEKDNLRFFECYLNTPLEICEERDVKGLYKKAREGLIKGFTGIDQPYEIPENPDLVLGTAESSIEDCIQKVINFLIDNGIIEAETIEPVELFADESKKQLLIEESLNLESIELEIIDTQWLQILSEGWATPLRGFMREKEYLSCLHFGSINRNGITYSQSIPIVLPINELKKQQLINKNTVALKFNNKLVAILRNIEIYEHRKIERCARVFGCIYEEHPSIKLIMNSGDWLIGGDLEVLERIKWNDGLDDYRLTPKEIQLKLRKMNADVTFVFQLRNPVHNGHAFLMNDTKRMLIEKGYKNPVLLLHPLGGWTKDDDVPLNVRIKQHMAVLEEGVLNKNSTLIAVFPSPMSYAGPREVQWHAKARIHTASNWHTNTYYIVGRDPAGISKPNSSDPLYNVEDGANVLSMTPGLSNLQIIPFKVAAYNKKLKQMTFFDEQHGEEFEFISGSQMRKIARAGGQLPEGFMVESAWKILAEYYNNLI